MATIQQAIDWTTNPSSGLQPAHSLNQKLIEMMNENEGFPKIFLIKGKTDKASIAKSRDQLIEHLGDRWMDRIRLSKYQEICRAVLVREDDDALDLILLDAIEPYQVLETWVKEQHGNH
jgi:hypothetical protein